MKMFRILTPFFLFCSFSFCEIIDAKIPSSLSDLGVLDNPCTQTVKNDIKSFYISYYNSFIKNKFRCSDDFALFDAVNARNDLQDLINDFNSKCASMKWNKIVPSYECLSELEVEELAKLEKIEKERILKEKNKEFGLLK